MAQKFRQGLAGLLLLLPTIATEVAAASIEQQRAWYSQAREAVNANNQTSYRKLRDKLDDYPLAPYLDYRYYRGQLNKLSATDAKRILDELAETPLQSPFKYRFLARQGLRQKWDAFLQVSPEVPRSEQLQCYYYRAQLNEGNHAKAYQGAKTLWLHGKSRDKACDPLFKQWTDAGQRSDELVWQRMLLAYQARQYNLLSYLNRQLSNAFRYHGDRLVRAYQSPLAIRWNQQQLRDPREQQIALAMLPQLARKADAQAWQRFAQWQPYLSQTEQQTTARKLLYRSLLNDQWSPQHASALEQFGSDKLLEQRLRQTIFASDWHGTKHWLNRLSSTAQNSSEWQYWRGVVQSQFEGATAAEATWLQLAKRRNFYGFMAAQQLSQPYALQQQLPTFSEQQRREVEQQLGYLRIQELMQLNKLHEAKRELRWLLDRLEPAQQAALLASAHDKQWHMLTIEGTIKTKLWDALPWRFPTAYGDHFMQFAELRQLDMALLQAVARRESALYPKAKSSANAHGLMQLLPSTAKATANKIGAPYQRVSDLYQPKRNIQLGSAYYRQLYQQYDGNRLLASAAYNAGPHRVKRWLERSGGKLTVAQFVATIPFRETRDYVQAILSYQLIYAALDQRSTPLMTDSERNLNY
ncbi:transglycosylase SLT domain-containing protein [Ferrimonas senticii]|uniref:transglycosylase SLT domain-containing protein n=1 Tax=Ferrimonas senticii TaxID=394566 RepID=UPI00040FAF15|nr:transglycosylase SLT domain-containing protein [Ferrimonas senticii]